MTVVAREGGPQSPAAIGLPLDREVHAPELPARHPEKVVDIGKRAPWSPWIRGFEDPQLVTRMPALLRMSYRQQVSSKARVVIDAWPPSAGRVGEDRLGLRPDLRPGGRRRRPLEVLVGRRRLRVARRHA